MYYPIENIGEGLDQILAFIEMLGLIFFYILTTITLIQLTVKDKFDIKRPFKNFRFVAISSILIFLVLISYYIYNSFSPDMWFKILIISFLASTFPALTLIFSSVIFAFIKSNIFRGVVKLVGAGAIVCMVAFLINQTIYALISPFFAFSAALLIYLIAPFFEESLKAAILILFKNKGWKIEGTASIVLTAFAIGAGFAFIENLIYFTVLVNPVSIGIGAWINIILNRIYISSTAHGFFVLMTLMGMQKKFFKSIKEGLFAAIVFHILFNVFSFVLTDFFAREILIALAALLLLIKLLELARNNTNSRKGI
ncbi:PrsW family intramembrane metalloprotease [Candidatus Micrarchaeota archaeon]|nr:PrsW family intramembrane metalloprotease [Candidatus Micrarchaeota archaeon]